MRTARTFFFFNLILQLLISSSCNKEDGVVTDNEIIQLSSAKINNLTLVHDDTLFNVPVDPHITLSFSAVPDTSTVYQSISLMDAKGIVFPYSYSLSGDNKSLTLALTDSLDFHKTHTLALSSSLKGRNGETFPGVSFHFRTEQGRLLILSSTLNGVDFVKTSSLREIDLFTRIDFNFNLPLDTSGIYQKVDLFGRRVSPLEILFSEDQRTLTIINSEKLDYYTRYTVFLSGSIQAQNGFEFEGFIHNFFTKLDSSYKFPEISDEELLDRVQQQTFKYFWDFGHPVSGLARERNTSGDVVTSGGSGFGIMAIIVGINRGYISRDEGRERLKIMVDFLGTADRFHGVWPHWMNGNTGKVIPFGADDDGGDLVETAFLAMGLLTARQYLDSLNNFENSIIKKINSLLETIEWDWYTQGQNSLTWHWSPRIGFAKNMKIRGWNEALIVYVLAASFDSHPISKEVYTQGWASNGGMINNKTFYGINLPLGPDLGGPLFFEHYSFLGLDPRNLSDSYGNYFEQARNHSLINRAYCIDNPRNYIGYSEACWGLTASDNHQGYSAHSPTHDLGVITPTAALSSFPYTPEESMQALRHFYYLLGDRLWGPYGFYDAFNVTENWYASSYIAIDQGPIIGMIENYRTGLLWQLFMSAPEVQSALTKLGFSY